MKLSIVGILALAMLTSAFILAAGCRLFLKDAHQKQLPINENTYTSAGLVQELLPSGTGKTMNVDSSIEQPPELLSTVEWQFILDIIGRIPDAGSKIVKVECWANKMGRCDAVKVWTEKYGIGLRRLSTGKWRVEDVSFWFI